MTGDPPRLLEDGTLTADERRALEAAAEERSPLGAKAAIWAVLSLELAAPATAAAASVTAAATGVTAASGAGAGAAGLLTTVALVKSAAVGLALGAAVGSGLYFSGRAEPPPPAPRELRVEGATSVAAPFHAAAAAPNARAPAEEASAAPSTTASEPRGEVARAERPREVPPVESESQRVARARASLRAGDANRALETLGALARDEPNGLLAQEREALAIEALAALGRRDAARARADAFLARYPASPHVLAVRHAAGYAP